MGVARRTTATLVLAAGLAACGLVGDPGPVRDEPVGPTVVVAEGREGDGPWRFEVYRTAGGFCEWIVTGSEGGPGGCASGNVDIAPGSANVSARAGTDQPTYVYGQAGDDVATVRITTSDGNVTTVETIAAPAELELRGRFFIEVLPEGAEVLSVATLDGEGSVMETIELRRP